MKNQITLKGGIVLMAMSLMFFTSCKKEEITSKKSMEQSENHGIDTPNYKFSAVAKIPGENPENGFLLLTVSSDDEAFLKKYVEKLEQTKISMQEVNSTYQDEKDMKPLFDEKESASPVGLDFNWNNFKFNREKGKFYKVCALGADESKSLVYYTAFNGANFNFGFGFAAVNIYSTYRYWNINTFSYENMNNCNWGLSNGSSVFYTQTLSYHGNLEVRCFQPVSYPTPFDYFGFSYFTINNITTYFRPRLNYTSPDMPSSYKDENAIITGGGVSTKKQEGSPADLTFYIAG
nr:hypothetical protein [uncultured Fluviicola sp.]